jgi:hypothetical protein
MKVCLNKQQIEKVIIVLGLSLLKKIMRHHYPTTMTTSTTNYNNYNNSNYPIENPLTIYYRIRPTAHLAAWNDEFS